ncbi:hypothetical protein H6F38_14300 [Paenibacillus sp. EKM208P]|nr:hypothetical protein H6F38_14300 [Paenibacillus sp. EKM208P]
MNKTIRVSGRISKDVEGILLGCEVLGKYIVNELAPNNFLSMVKIAIVARVTMEYGNFTITP